MAGAPAAAGDAVAAPVGGRCEVAVELGVVAVAAPVQQGLLPGPVEQQQAFVQLDLVGVELPDAREHPRQAARDALERACCGTVGPPVESMFPFARHGS